MHEDSLYCDVHYGLHSGSGVAGTHDLMPPGPLTPGGPVGPPFVPDPMGHSPNYLNFPPIPGGFPGGPPPCSDPTSNAGNGGWYPPASASDFPPGLGGPGGDFQYDNNNVNDPIMKKRRGRKKRKVETFAAMNGYLEAAGGYPPGMDGQGGPGKTKRARTSFKHHQLRIMKHHFNINQNPDSRELKILSQKTGLDKKVLQVNTPFLSCSRFYIFKILFLLLFGNLVKMEHSGTFLNNFLVFYAFGVILHLLALFYIFSVILIFGVILHLFFSFS